MTAIPRRPTLGANVLGAALLFHRDRETLQNRLAEALGPAAADIELRPCAELEGSDDPAGRSHFGGAPLAPAGFQWPRTTQDNRPQPGPWTRVARRLGLSPPPAPPPERPLAFVLQIDLADLPPPVRDHLRLPADGLLAFFYDYDAPWTVGEARRQSIHLACFTGPVVETPLPADLAAKNRTRPVPIRLNPGWMSPDPPSLSEADMELWYALLDESARTKTFEIPGHFIGGWPISAQGDVFVEAHCDRYGGRWPDETSPEWAAIQAGWRQVLQLRGAAAFMGRLHSEAELYVLLDPTAAEAADLDQAWVQLQFY